MAAQSSLREELKILRRKAWERRNQEVLQDKELYQETTPLFGEPVKRKKDDELSTQIQKLLGNYDNCNVFQYSQCDVLSKDPPLGSLHGGRGSSAHKGKAEPIFPTSSPHGGSKQGHSRHSTPQNFKKYPSLNTPSTINSKDPPVQPQPRKSDSWSDARNNPGLPRALPDLSPLRRPLSPLHSSDSSDSEQDAVHNYDGSLSPEGNHDHSLFLERPNDRSFPPEVNSSLGSLAASTGPLGSHLKETSGDAPLMAPQTFPPPLSSKPSLANSKKPMALVRPMDGPDQVISESPDLKPSPDDFLRQSYENLSDLKNNSRPSLPPLKMPSQPVEVLSNDVQRVDEILKEMTYSCPPLLTAIQTPSTAEPSKFPFPNKEPPVPPAYQQSQKRQEPSPKAPAVAEPAVCVSTASTLAPPSGGESTSSSDSESSSGSESDGESSESGTEETPPASSTNTPPAKVEAPKDINWQLSTFFKESKQSPTPQNQGKGLKHSTKPQTEEKPKVRNKKRHNSKSSDAHVEEKAPQINQHVTPKPATDGSISVENRKTMSGKPPGKSSKPHSSLLVESVEVTPRNQDATFRERPKSKSKPEGGKSSTHGPAVKKEAKDERPAKAILDRKEVEPKRALNVKSPSAKNSTKGRDRLPKTERGHEKTPKANGDQSLALVVKIKLSHLNRIPKVGTKSGTRNQLVEPLEAEKQITGVGKKRPAEQTEQTAPKKKPKLEKDGKSASSSQCHAPGRTQTKKSRENKEKERKSSKKDPPAPPPSSAQGSGNKKRSVDLEESSKSKKKSREEHGKNNKKTVRIGSSGAPTVTPPPKRPLLKVDHRPHSVDHHLMEAKKLKHKADAMGDKMSKAFSYLDAAMSFVESGIAMETDSQTPKSAYTMFSDTVDLIRFILKLKNYLDPSAPASERDFFVLCMRCKALLQMAMFRCNRDSALDYCRTLTDYFKSSKTVKAPSPCVAKITSPGSPMPSPASSVSSNPGGMSSSTVSIPQLVQQMASSYINITSLFLSAHETWEQAEELARTRTGLLNELDVAMGRLSLTSSMSSLVRYTRQGLHWLKLDSLIPRPGPCA